MAFVIYGSTVEDEVTENGPPWIYRRGLSKSGFEKKIKKSSSSFAM
jgi:hypothetical protein